MPTKTLKLPSQKQLREDFTYNVITGDFRRCDGYYGAVTNELYLRIKYLGVAYQVHRLVWKWWYGYDPEYVDHINGDRIDNRIDNLRNIPFNYNARNQKKRIDNTSGHSGINWHENSQKWVARVGINNKIINIGSFRTIDEAVAARKEFVETFLPKTFSERHGK